MGLWVACLEEFWEWEGVSITEGEIVKEKLDPLNYVNVLCLASNANYTKLILNS